MKQQRCDHKILIQLVDWTYRMHRPTSHGHGLNHLLIIFPTEIATKIDGIYPRRCWVGVAPEELILAYEPVMVMARRDRRTIPDCAENMRFGQGTFLPRFLARGLFHPGWWIMLSNTVWNSRKQHGDVFKQKRRFEANSFFLPICTSPHFHYWYVVLNLRVTQKGLGMVKCT